MHRSDIDAKHREKYEQRVLQEEIEQLVTEDIELANRLQNV
jgi:hypothetical protein